MFSVLEHRISIFLEQDVDLVTRTILDKHQLPNAWRKVTDPSLSNQEVISQIWEPFDGVGDQIIRLLKDNVKDLLVVVSDHSKYPIALCYVFYRSNGYLSSWVAFPPLTNSSFTFGNLQMAELPFEYRQFLSIHNGFLLDGNGSIGIFSTEKLTQVHNEDKGRTLLAFSGDGLGNLQCFDLPRGNDKTGISTIFWDHETKEVDSPLIFLDYFTDYLKRMMK